MFSFPRTAPCGRMIGHEFNQIPQIETEEQKLALLLFRDALSSNHDYLAFLLFWQVLETGGNDPIGWINKTYRQNRNKMRLTEENFQNLPLNGKSLGHYLYDDCRNAIAHIRRKVGKVRLKLDTAEDNQRIALGTHIIKEFARFYIKNKLNLQKTMYLVRKNGRGFPVFANEEFLDKYRCTIAYKSLTIEQKLKKRWH